MKRFSILSVLFWCFQISCLADEHYQNAAYGVEAKIVDDWEIVSTAKLDVDLRSLSDEQLSELIRGKYGVLHLRKGDTKTAPSITIDLMPLTRSKFQTAMEHAESWKRGAISRGETVEQGPEACKIGEATAASIVITRSANSRSFTTYQYFVRRARSIVLITGIVHQPADESTTDQLTRMIENISIAEDADQPSQAQTP